MPLGFRKLHFLILLIPLITGMRLGLLLKWDGIYDLGMALVLTIYLAFIYSSGRCGKRTRLVDYLFFPLITIITVLISHGISQKIPRMFPLKDLDTCSEKGKVIDLVIECRRFRQKNAFVRMEADVLAVWKDGEMLPVSGRILVLKRDTGLIFKGCYYYTRGMLTEIPGSSIPGAFDPGQYYGSRNIRYQLKSGKHDFLEYLGKPPNVVDNFIGGLRKRALQRVRKLVPGPSEQAIVCAMFLGDRGEMTTELKNHFSRAGVMHILAVSGLHVGIIYMMLGFFIYRVLRTRKDRIAGLMAVICGIWLYAVITGLSSSVIRSAFMFTVISIGNSIGRKVNIYHLIAFTAFVILCLEPYRLDDIGFQLSYIAVAGIVWLFPVFRSMIRSRYRIVNWSWSMISVTMAAQLATFPLTSYYFHQFPNYFIFSNLLAVPGATVIVGLGFVALLTADVIVVSSLIGQLLTMLVKNLYLIVTFFSTLPFSITEIHIDRIEIPFIYLLIILTGMSVISPGKKIIQALMLTALLLITYRSASIIVERSSNRIFVLRHRGQIYLGVKSGSDLKLAELGGRSAGAMPDRIELSEMLNSRGLKNIKFARLSWDEENGMGSVRNLEVQGKRVVFARVPAYAEISDSSVLCNASALIVTRYFTRRDGLKESCHLYLKDDASVKNRFKTSSRFGYGLERRLGGMDYEEL